MGRLGSNKLLGNRKMTKYEVKLTFKYSDIVHVEAENKKQAIEMALEECNEQYESFYDADVKEE